jgi:hypothetical protein
MSGDLETGRNLAQVGLELGLQLHEQLLLWMAMQFAAVIEYDAGSLAKADKCAQEARA